MVTLTLPKKQGELCTNTCQKTLARECCVVSSSCELIWTNGLAVRELGIIWFATICCLGKRPGKYLDGSKAFHLVEYIWGSPKESKKVEVWMSNIAATSTRQKFSKQLMVSEQASDFGYSKFCSARRYIKKSVLLNLLFLKVRLSLNRHSFFPILASCLKCQTYIFVWFNTCLQCSFVGLLTSKQNKWHYCDIVFLLSFSEGR